MVTLRAQGKALRAIADAMRAKRGHKMEGVAGTLRTVGVRLQFSAKPSSWPNPRQ